MADHRPTQLAQLVTDRRTLLGLSYRQLATLAGTSTSAAHKIASGGIASLPSDRVAEGLARALQIDKSILLGAAVADLGVHEFTAGEGERQTIVSAVEKLCSEDRKAVLAVIARMGGPPPQPPPPTTSADVAEGRDAAPLCGDVPVTGVDA